MKQKEIFLESEENQWFARNEKYLRTQKMPDDDALLLEIRDFHKHGFPLTDAPEEMTAISIIRKNSL